MTPNPSSSEEIASDAGAPEPPSPHVETDAELPPPPPPRKPFWQGRPWLSLVVLILAGAVVYSPALTSPFMIDDYLQAAMTDGTYPTPRAPYDLYNFVSDADRGVLIERGVFPWWTSPALTVRFFRPMSSALRWAEHKLLGPATIATHVHSLFWWLAAVLAARALFKQLLAPRTAAIATLVFAFAPAHAIPLTWLANREALISLACGIVGLAAQVRFREKGSPLDAVIATLAFALAVAGGEYGLCMGGYVLAMELFRRRDSIVRRAAALLTFAAPAAAYLAIRTAGHYGAAASGFYADPFRETGLFLRGAPRRFATLIVDQWLTLDADSINLATHWWLVAGLAVFVVGMVALTLRDAVRAMDAEGKNQVAWALTGSLLGLAPMLAVAPSPRVLGVSLVGTALLVARILEHAWFSNEWRQSRGLSRVLATFIGFLHLVHAPVTAFLVARVFASGASAFNAHVATLREQLGDVSKSEVIVIRGAGAHFFFPFALAAPGAPPIKVRVLSQAGHLLALRRGPRTVDLVVAKDRSLFPSGPGNVFRREEAKLPVGSAFIGSDMRATVLDLGAQDGPRIVRFEFDRDLDDASFVWLNERAQAYEVVKMPNDGLGAPFNP